MTNARELLDADGLDVIEALVVDATAVEGVANVHEGSGYLAERVIRRAVEQGSLIVVGPANHPAYDPASDLARQVTQLEAQLAEVREGLRDADGLLAARGIDFDNPARRRFRALLTQSKEPK